VVEGERPSSMDVRASVIEVDSVHLNRQPQYNPRTMMHDT
jgi:hypothetical protein